MGFLDSLGKAADWLKDSPVGQVVDVAFSPVDDDSQLGELVNAVDDFGKKIPGYRVNKWAIEGVKTDLGDFAEGLDKMWDQGTRPWSTVNLQIKHIADGDFGEFVNPTAWKQAWRTSDSVTIGQSALSGGLVSLAQRPGARLADQRMSPKERQKFYSVYPWLREDFDITDRRQRDQAFKDSFQGRMISGGNDLVARWYLDPGNVAAFGAMRGARLYNIRKGRLITSTNVDTAVHGDHTERVLDWIDRERAAGGDVAARLHDHPALRKNSHGAWVATALADAKDRNEARDVLGLLYGDDAALRRLEKTNQELADKIQLRAMEAVDLERTVNIGDPELIDLGFDANHLPERLKLVQTELNAMVTQEKLNERTLEIAKLFQGERALDYGAKEAAFVANVRHDVWQKGGSNRVLRFVRPAVAMAPHKMVNVNRPNSSVQVERFLRKTRAPINEQDELLEQYLRAVTPAERAQILTDIEDKAVRYALRDLDDETLGAVLAAASKGRAKSMQALAGAERRYEGRMAYSMVKVSHGDQEIHYPLLVSQTQDIVPMVDIDQLHRISNRYRSSIKMLRDSNPGVSVLKLAPWLADRYYRLWKPATLLRPAWPLRVVGDEQLRIIGKLQGMVHGDWRKLGVSELRSIEGQRAPKLGFKATKGRFGLTQLETEQLPAERLPRADLAPYGADRPIDEMYVNGEVTEEQFKAFVKRQAEVRGFVPAGYEDIWEAYQRGDYDLDELAHKMAVASHLRSVGYYYDQSDAERAYNAILASDGVTVDITTGTSPTRGFAVSTRPDLGVKMDLSELTPKAIQDFIRANGDELRKPGRMLGAWVEEEDAVFDELYPGMGPVFFGRTEPTLKMKPLIDPETGDFTGAGQLNLYGPGIYTTDDASVALEYTSKDRGARTETDYWPPFSEHNIDSGSFPPDRDLTGHPQKVTEPEDIYTVHWKGEGEPKFLDLDAKVADLPAEAREVFEEVLQRHYAGHGPNSDEAAAIILRGSGRDDLGDFFNELRNDYTYAMDNVDEFVADLYDELGQKGFAGWTHQGGRIMGDHPHTVRIFFDPTKLERVKVSKKGLKRRDVYEELPPDVVLTYPSELARLPFRSMKHHVDQEAGDYNRTPEYESDYSDYHAKSDVLLQRMREEQGVSSFDDVKLDPNNPVVVGIDDNGRMGVLDGGKRVVLASGSGYFGNKVPVKFVRVRNIPWGRHSEPMYWDDSIDAYMQPETRRNDSLVQAFENMGVGYGDSFAWNQVGHSVFFPFQNARPKLLGRKMVRDVAYLDVSRVVKDEETARDIGLLANQIAAWDIAGKKAVDIGGTGEFNLRRAWNSPEVSAEKWRRAQEQIAYRTGEEVKPIDYDPLQGAYLGISSWMGHQYAGPYGAGPNPNQFWDLSSSRGALHNLADHYERDGIQAASNHLRNWRSLEPGDEGYESAWEIAANGQIGNDPMARMFLQGKSYEDVLAWLRGTKEGILHRKTLPVRGQNPEEWVGMVEDMVNTYLPTERLRQLALMGQARYSHLVDEMGHAPLPVVHGEDLGTALGSSDFWKWYEGWTSKMFERLGGMPTDHLSRHPYFATMYHAKVRQAIDTSIEQGTEITPEMIGRLERMGREFALSETKKLLYDLAEQSDLARMMRFLAPFYGAWQETLTRWAGIAYENPVVLSRAHLIWDAPHKAGLIYDRQTGEPIYDPHSGVDLKDQIVRLRLPKWATRDIPGAELIPGAEQAQWLATFGGNAEGINLSKGGFNLITMGEPWWLPGLGPTVQIPVNELVKDRPDLAETPVGRYILPYGPTNTGSTIGDVLQMSLPSAYKRVAAIPQDEGNAVFGNMKLRIYTTELVKYQQGLRPKKPTWKEATWKARSMFSIWALATWVSPTGIAPISPVEPYVIEYRALLEADQKKDRTDPNYMSPDAIFLERHGEELFALTGSLTKSANSAPATLGAYKATKKYAREIQKVSDAGSPELAGLIIGSQGAGEFNYSVYQYQLNNETYPGSGVMQRERLSPREKLADRAAAAGWIEYRKIMDQIEHERVAQGLSSLNVKEAAGLRFLKSTLIDNLRKSNPDWGVDYDQVDRGVMRRRITNLRAVISANKELRGRQDIQGVVEYLRLRDMVVQELRTRQDSTLAAQSNADLAFLFDTAVGNLVERNLAFQDTYYRYLERDELSASDHIGGE